jgi:hypothetical protein
MQIVSWFLPLSLWTRDLLAVSGTTVSFKSTGEAVVYKAAPDKPYVPLRSEPEARVQMPGGWNVSSFTMNVTIVDAHENGLIPHSLADLKNIDPKTNQEVTVVSSWILFHMPGNHTDSLQQPTLPKLVGGLRDSVADALEVCRSSLGIVDMRAINIDVIDKVDLEEDEDTLPPEKESKNEGTTLLEHAASLMRRMRAEDTERSHVNVTQIKAVYEVRVFKEMRLTEGEVGRRIDKFQIYSKFSDLNRLLGRSMSQVDGHSMDGVMLDDVGYASKHQLLRPPLTSEELADCAEEVSLHDARQIHQFVMAMSLIMVALITCAGSTVFTIKHASSVPSRMNPLVQTS